MAATENSAYVSFPAHSWETRACNHTCIRTHLQWACSCLLLASSRHQDRKLFKNLQCQPRATCTCTLTAAASYTCLQMLTRFPLFMHSMCSLPATHTDWQCQTQRVCLRSGHLHLTAYCTHPGPQTSTCQLMATNQHKDSLLQECMWIANTGKVTPDKPREPCRDVHAGLAARRGDVGRQSCYRRACSCRRNWALAASPEPSTALQQVTALGTCWRSKQDSHAIQKRQPCNPNKTAMQAYNL